MWNMDFISEEDFHGHVANTIAEYAANLLPYDETRFNSNLIDPIKFVFDKAMYRMEWDEVVRNEIFRQRDKSNNNSIGYFHQKMFAYIAYCDVPRHGWDVIFQPPDGIVFSGGGSARRLNVEIKNKHNTMNSSAAAQTYLRMRDAVSDDDECACALVEVIARRSQDEPWKIMIGGQHRNHRLIRRMSMDNFYALVTGDDEAFYKICMALPDAVDSVIRSSDGIMLPQDSVMDELLERVDGREASIPMALYLLGFPGYRGFPEA